jgi:hypothetical protein
MAQYTNFESELPGGFMIQGEFRGRKQDGDFFSCGVTPSVPIKVQWQDQTGKLI